MSDSENANRCDRKETDPLAAHHRSESKSGQGEPDPPSSTERSHFSRPVSCDLVLVREADPEEGGEGGEEDEGRVEEDEAGLGDEAILEHDHQRAEHGGRWARFKRAEGEVRERDEEEPERRGEESHGDVGDPIWTVLASDVLEIKGAALESRDVGHESDEELRERGMHVHKEARLDVPASLAPRSRRHGGPTCSRIRQSAPRQSCAR